MVALHWGKCLKNLKGHYFVLFQGKEMADEFNYALERTKESSCDESYYDLEAEFSGASERTSKCIMDALQKLGQLNKGCAILEWSSENIMSWKVLFESYIKSLQLECICDDLHKTIFCAVSCLFFFFLLWKLIVQIFFLHFVYHLIWHVSLRENCWTIVGVKCLIYVSELKHILRICITCWTWYWTSAMAFFMIF